MVRVQADLNVGIRLIGDCLRPAKQATHDRGSIEPLLQDDGALAFIHELTGNHIWHSGSVKRLQPARAYASDRVPQALFQIQTPTPLGGTRRIIRASTDKPNSRTNE
jgi:hypothetical protein